MTSETGPGKAKVFVSYSRKDDDFADQLATALEEFDFTALMPPAYHKLFRALGFDDVAEFDKA
jgi:hypothetical protein